MRLHDYLRRVGVAPGLPPTADTLRRLHVAHREAFLFDNVAIQTGGTISVALDAIERKFIDEGRGGYCFEHNTLFASRPARPRIRRRSPCSAACAEGRRSGGPARTWC